MSCFYVTGEPGGADVGRMWGGVSRKRTEKRRRPVETGPRSTWGKEKRGRTHNSRLWRRFARAGTSRK